MDLALGLSTLWRNAVSYAEGRRWVTALAAHDLEARERLWTLILDADVALGSGDPGGDADRRGASRRPFPDVDDEGAAVLAAVYDAMAHLVPFARAAGRLEAAAARPARWGVRPRRLARGFRLVALLLDGQTDGLREEGLALTDEVGDRDYARYLCHWAASLVALVDTRRSVVRPDHGPTA